MENKGISGADLIAENRANNRPRQERQVRAFYCLYARKSSEDDERQALSIDSQIREMQELARREGLTIKEIRRESHSAKASGERPEFNRLMADIDNGTFNAILTWAPDRLSRNGGDLGRLIDLMDTGKLVEIRTHSQTFTNSPNEKFLLMILGSQAKLENDNRGINVRRGLKNKVEMGWRPGMPPLGYHNEKSINRGQNRIFVDEERAPTVRRMFEMVAFEGMSGRQIYTWLQETGFRTRTGKRVTLSSIYLMLRNPFYYGSFEFPKNSGNWYKGAHEPLITKELFDRVQESMFVPDLPKYGQKDFKFIKLFTCGSCGSGITAEEKIKRNKGNGMIHRYVYYRCCRSKDRYCPEKAVSEPKMMKQLLTMMDTIDIDKIGARKHIDAELKRYMAFNETVLGKKVEIPTNIEANVRTYAKYILQHGTREEKRQLLEKIKNTVVISDRILTLKTKAGK